MRALKIKDYPEYHVTDTGDIYSRKEYHNPNGRIKKLKPVKQKTGYLHIVLYKNGIGKTFRVHRIVAQTFIPNPLKLPEINHINGIKDDNRVENLEWCTSSENTIHSNKVLHLGCKAVQQIKNGIVVAEFYSAREASRKTNIHSSLISKCCNGDISNAHGFQWRYND